jgi:transposase InsO family protein
VSVSTLERAFTAQLTPAERAMWRDGENARRAADVYLTRPRTARYQIWELGHKQLPVLVLPPRGPAVCPWLTTVIDDSTRVLAGWAIMLTPYVGTVLTALRMALTNGRDAGSVRGRPTTPESRITITSSGVESVCTISPGRMANVGVNGPSGRFASERREVAAPKECRPVARAARSS